MRYKVSVLVSKIASLIVLFCRTAVFSGSDDRTSMRSSFTWIVDEPAALIIEMVLSAKLDVVMTPQNAQIREIKFFFIKIQCVLI